VHSVLRALGVAGALLVVAVLLGPRVPMDTAVSPPELPAGGLHAIAAAVREAEARVAGITPGAEKEVVFHDSLAPAVTPLSVVYLHGFSATRREIEPVPTLVAEAVGANRFMTRLTGHGRDGPAMAEATLNDWLQDGEEAMAVGSAIGERVVLVGTSTGGSLAVWLAAHSSLRDRIAALVLVSPNFGVPDPMAGLLLWPWGGTLARWVVGEEYSFEPRNEGQERWWTTRYPSSALLTMQAMVQQLRETDLSQVEVPVLVFYSPEDEVVDPAKTLAALEEFGTAVKEVVAVPRAPGTDAHVLAGDILWPGNNGPVSTRIVDFLRRVR
jgi:esterase/lipase